MFMRSFEAQAYALLRIVTGYMFLWHGMQKLLGFPQPIQAPAWILYIAGPIEMFGGILVMIGLFTRWAAFLSSGQMAAAYFIGHAFSQGVLKVFYPNPFGGNGGELAALYCFVFLFISARGPGIWAVDES